MLSVYVQAVCLVMCAYWVLGKAKRKRRESAAPHRHLSDLIQLLAAVPPEAVNKTQTFYGAFHLLKDANLFMGGCNSARVCIGQLGLGCVFHIPVGLTSVTGEIQRACQLPVEG